SFRAPTVELSKTLLFKLTVSDGKLSTSSVTEVIVRGRPSAKPSITQIRSQYPFDFFLEGISVSIKYTVSVDWSGQPGVIEYVVNGAKNQVPATATGGSFTV